MRPSRSAMFATLRSAGPPGSTVIENGRTGYISCDPDELTARMRFLLDHPAEARRLGDNAREAAQARFNLDRFIRDWNEAFAQAIALHDAGQSHRPEDLRNRIEQPDRSTAGV